MLIFGCDKYNIAPFSTVSAGGSPSGAEFLPQKGDGSVSAIAGFHVELYLIDKFHRKE